MYDQYLRRTTSLPSQGFGSIVTAIDFETRYEVQNNKLNASKINLGNFIKESPSGSAFGNFSTTQALNLTSSITYNTPHTNVRTFGLPNVGIFQGSSLAAADQIYPIRGTNVTLGRYDVVGGVGDYTHYDGTSCEWRAMVIDTNGTSSQQITFATKWIYTDYVTDEIQ